MKLPKSIEILKIAAALIIPGGMIALGLWQVYKIYKKKQNDKVTDNVV